jgi:hypothetical protein
MRTHDLLDKQKGKRKALDQDQSLSGEDITEEEELIEAGSSRPNKSMYISKNSIQYANKHIVRRLTSSFANVSFQYDAPFTQAPEEFIAQPVPFSGKLFFFICDHSYSCNRSLPRCIANCAAYFGFAGY